MRPIGGSALVAAMCFGFVLGALSLLVFTVFYRSDSGDSLFSRGWVTASEPPTVLKAPKVAYLVRPEAPKKGVNVVRVIHQRPPASDAEAARWIDAGEMVAVEPGTAVKVSEGNAPPFAVTVEVLNGPREGLRGWVWQDTLRDQWP